MREVFRKFKDIWAVPRYQALIQLGLYAIFFLGVFIFVSSFDKGDYINESKSALEKFKDLTSYKYEVNDIIVSVVGYQKIVTYENMEYDVSEIPLEISEYISDLTPLNISELISKGTLESTNYISNSETYLIKIMDFNKIVYDIEMESEEEIKIVVYEENNSILRIEIDLTNHYEYEYIIVFKQIEG